MLEVHPPEHAPHSVRDFFLHIFTITIGLLIALGLESLVEWRHHVHLAHEAAANLRRELKENSTELTEVVSAAAEEQTIYRNTLLFLRQRERGQATDLHAMRLRFKVASLKDASWQTASATGALSYMPYDEVQRFASAYQLQRQYQGIQDAAVQPAIALMASLTAEDPNGMSPAAATAAISQVHSMMANVEALREFGNDVNKAYTGAMEE